MFNESVMNKMKNIFSCVRKQESDAGRPKRRKMVIVGDGECGKTCLITRMATGQFVDDGYIPTVFETEVVNVHTGLEEVELIMFDTAGQEDYDRLRPFSYNDVDVVLICFSLAEPDTLANVMANWWPEIRYFCGPDVPVILVGNKKDLRDVETSIRSSSNASISKQSTSNTSIEDGEVTKCVSPTTELQLSTLKNEKSRPASELYTSPMKPFYRSHAPIKHSEGVLSAKGTGALAYFETSSLTGENTQELLLATAKAAVLGKKKSKKFKPFIDTLRSWKSISTLNQT